LSFAELILLAPLEVDMLRCPPVASQSSEENPESDEKALLVTTAGREGPAPILEEVDVSEVSVAGILEGLPKAQWQRGPPATVSSTLNEDDSSPWPESSLLDSDDELVLTYR
jgi:hypothetical protein